MILEIITPEKTVFKEEIDELLVPTDKGQIGILPHHINLITNLANGEIIIKIKGKEQILGVTGGFLEVKHDKVTILADYAQHADLVDTQASLEAKRRAEEILKNKHTEMPQEDLIKAEAELRRALLDLHIANNQAKRHRNTR